VNNAPVKDNLPVEQIQNENNKWQSRWTAAWVTWFTQVLSALQGWRKTFTGSLTYDFGAIDPNDSTTVTVTGARVGDAVLVTPSLNTAGIVEKGVVTDVDEVTIYAMNATGGSVNPAEKTYRVIVFQQ